MENEFGIGGVPIKVAAKVYGKDPAWVRHGINVGYLPIGVAIKTSKRTNYYISPKKLYEHTGYIWRGYEYND